MTVAKVIGEEHQRFSSFTLALRLIRDFELARHRHAEFIFSSFDDLCTLIVRLLIKHLLAICLGNPNRDINILLGF